MGSYWSCCRREKSPEKEPLLAKSRSYQPNTSFEKLGDIVGAFNSGKIPSQDQVAGLLQRVLRSEFLNDPAPSSGGPLSRRGIALVLGIKELMESVLRVGLEKNCSCRLLRFPFLTEHRRQRSPGLAISKHADL
jgi:hypothetical protein